MLKTLRRIITWQNFFLMPTVGLSIFLLGNLAWNKISPTPVVVSEVKPRHPDLILMDEVRKVNADASTIMLSSLISMGLDEPVSCMVADGASNDPQSRSNPSMKSFVEKKLTECKFSKYAKSTVYKTFNMIAVSGALPKDLFAFEAFKDDKWELVGLFNGLVACEDLLKVAMQNGIGVKNCEVWKPRF